MEKLAQAFFAHLQRGTCEYGGIGLDDKRPFGNSDVEGDILRILDCKMEGDDGNDKCWSSEQREYATELYDELIEYLQERYGGTEQELPAAEPFLSPGVYLRTKLAPLEEFERRHLLVEVYRVYPFESVDWYWGFFGSPNVNQGRLRDSSMYIYSPISGRTA